MTLFNQRRDLMGAKIMSEDWLDPALAALQHLPGLGGLGLGALAMFRVGRVAGNVESDLKTQAEKLADLHERLTAAEKAQTDLTVKIAELPKREEVRGMFAELREDIRGLRTPARGARAPQ
jgi:hypothetical protein